MRHTRTMAQRSLPVRLEFERHPAASGVVVVVDRGMSERLLRALFALAVCFAFAGVCVFVPLSHFVLVPTFVVTGVTLFLLRLREHASLVSVRGSCPSCREEKLILSSGRFRDGRSVRCDQCATQMRLIVDARAPATSPAEATADPG
jgi:hypothetical protein